MDGGKAGPGEAVDPVCGMTVRVEVATSRGLHYQHEGVDYYFCGRGCRLDFEEDPARYLDPGYQPSM
jgi:YHS domain-containing protein